MRMTITILIAVLIMALGLMILNSTSLQAAEPDSWLDAPCDLTTDDYIEFTPNPEMKKIEIWINGVYQETIYYIPGNMKEKPIHIIEPGKNK